MPNTRWIEVAVLGLAIPLLHAYWMRNPEIKKPVSTFTAAQPVIPKKHSFQPKNEQEALSHFMNEPLRRSNPVPFYTQSAGLNAQAAADAESAALEAMPNTSRH